MDPEGRAISYAGHNDAEAVATLATDFLNNRQAWEEKAIAGRQIMEDRFSSANVAQQYLEFYQHLADNPVR
jgi:glycosyltransferase involved in cell wall biosynthesis